MSPENGVPEEEHGHESLLVENLLDEVNFVVSEAFDAMVNTGSRSIVEMVQIDTETIPGTKLYSVLMSESGGKPERGVELVKILAYPIDPDMRLEDAVDMMFEGSRGLVYRPDKFILEHRFADGETVKRTKLSSEGLFDFDAQRDKAFFELTPEEFDISVQRFLAGEDDRQRKQSEEAELADLDMLIYGIHLYNDILINPQWSVIPQN